MSNIECICDSDRGIYQGQSLAENLNLTEWGIKQSDIDILLEGPDHEEYYDAWQDVIDNASKMIDGKEWRLHQDGDTFAFCSEELTDEEYLNLFGEPRE